MDREKIMAESVYTPEVPPASLTPEERIQRWKSRLLDLTLRNRLLNHRETANVLPVIGGDISTFYDTFLDGKAIRLMPADSSNATAYAPRTSDARRTQDLWTSGGTVTNVKSFATASFNDGATTNTGILKRIPTEANRLHVSLTENQFQKSCLAIYRQNRRELEESGSTTLFVGLGYLAWFEAKETENQRLAPLMLVPVTIERDRVGGPYFVTRAGEMMPNISLIKKLELDFELVIDMDEPPENGEKLLAWFEKIDQEVSRENFKVVHQIAVAFYSFGKMEMWMDLDRHAEALLENNIVRSIVDGSSKWLPSVRITEPEQMDTLPAVDDLSVMDADSSQRAAVQAALDGANLVLQGPPGTGKSQTITNLIAQTIGRGKTVLFISEKRAALDVVHNRLQEVGLGPFVLNAYANDERASNIVNQLKDPLYYEWSTPHGEWAHHAQKLATHRERLNYHKQMFHVPGPFGETIYQTIARLSVLNQNGTPRVRLNFPRIPDKVTYERLGERVTQYATRTRAIGIPIQHPYRLVQRAEWTATWAQDAADDIRQAHLAFEAMDQQRQKIEAWVLRVESAPASSSRAMGDAVLMLSACPLVPQALMTDDRSQIQQNVDRVSQTLTQWQIQKEKVAPTFALALLDEERLPQETARFTRWSSRLAFFAFFALFFARRYLAKFAQNELPANQALAADLEQATEAQTLQNQLRDDRDTMRNYFGSHWKDEDTNPQAIKEIWEWVKRYRATVNELRYDDPAAATRLTDIVSDEDALSAETSIGRLIDDLSTKVAAWNSAKENVRQHLDLGPEWTKLNDDAQHTMIAQWFHAPELLQPWCDWLKASRNLEQDGWQPLVDASRDGTLSADQIVPAWHRALREATWSVKCAKDPQLQAFRGVEQDRIIAEFQELDRTATDLARQEIQARIAQRLPSLQDPGEMDILRREFQKKTRHKPLRKLLQEAPNVIARLKPCILMSPLAVARYLDAGDQHFDLVVFDEASQIPPWDGIGAIARGKQVVVVGDTKQLPPTNFFQIEIQEEEEVYEELESILDQSISAGLNEMTLNWHYRSRHESLIAFSNQAYYHNRLHLFPSPRYDDPDLGLKWIHIKNGVYDRGGSRTNRREATTIVQNIVERLLDPKRQAQTIGVVTLSVAQRDLILDLLDDARRANPEIDYFFDSARHEPLFVRNLESVQGDERDIIFLSIGYGPDAAGKFTMNFGPINNTGGGRRLNVAITRARIQTVVISSFRYDEIARDIANPAVQELRGFLEYAHRGKPALISQAVGSAERAFDSPFEEQVFDVLTDAGWVVHPQVGVSGFFIDLAVVHPDYPGQYILGIECDGATYHSAKTARDRDRIRQNVLEGLGWHFHRIWSTDWWTQRSATAQRLLKAVQEAKIRADNETTFADVFVPKHQVSNSFSQKNDDSDDGASDTSDDYEDTLPNRVDELDYTRPAWPDNSSPWEPLPNLPPGSREMFHTPRADALLREQLQTVLNAASPIEFKHLAKHIADAWGFGSLGTLIETRIQEQLGAIGAGVRNDDDSVWRSKEQFTQWDGFRYQDSDTRKLEQVPMIEREHAMRWVLQRAYTIERDELFRETASIFGVRRLTKRVKGELEPALQAVLSKYTQASLEDETIVWQP